MKRNAISLTLTSMLLVLCLLLQLGSCVLTVSAQDLMEGISPRAVAGAEDLSVGNAAAREFSLCLLATEHRGANTLLSPLSVLCALAMTANGADGNTRVQMERLLGVRIEDLNSYLYSYARRLPVGERYRCSLANSIWFADGVGFVPDAAFLQTNADFFGADLYRAPFEAATLRDINRWVKNKTDGRIPSVLDELPADAVMYLICALAFDAEWAHSYERQDVRDGIFTTEEGHKRSVQMMYGTDGQYLEDSLATGFKKYYAAGSARTYAFVALLPNEGVTVEEYIASLDGEHLGTLLSEKYGAPLDSAIPKFELAYESDLAGSLCAMGMTDAFSSIDADLSRLGSSSGGNLYIDRVVHKTYIEVAEQGTRAGAVTAVEVKNESAADPLLRREVILDRPFLYMIVDCENSVPIFIGTVKDIGK